MLWRTLIAVTAWAAVVPTLAADGGLTFRLDCERLTVVRYEPLVVRYTVENSGTVPISLPGPLGLSAGWVKFEVAREGGRARLYHTGISERVVAKGRVLGAGERLSEQVVMVTNALPLTAPTTPAELAGEGVFPFAEPGTYTIRAELLLESDRSVASNVLRVTVNDAPAAQLPLADFPSLSDFAGAVGADADVADLKTAIERWRTFAAAHVDSIYTPFVIRNLANLYGKGTPTLTPDHRVSLEYAMRLFETGPQSLRGEALLLIGRNQAELGNVAAAQEALGKVVTLFPDTAAANEAKRISSGLAQGHRSLDEIFRH